MSHERKKKHGERKDKKNERMHEAVAERKAHAAPPQPHTDQQDLHTFKPGSAGDDSRHLPHTPPNIKQ